jgi:carboxymethylenebutenolidase
MQMRRILLLISIFALLPMAVAQDWARERLEKSPRHREWVTVKHDGRSVETFVDYP